MHTNARTHTLTHTGASHHGKDLQCVVFHPSWHESYQNLSCGYDDLNVEFSPQLVCPDRVTLWESMDEFSVMCQILSNPKITSDQLAIEVRREG